jgi:hypothetical protein
VVEWSFELVSAVSRLGSFTEGRTVVVCGEGKLSELSEELALSKKAGTVA